MANDIILNNLILKYYLHTTYEKYFNSTKISSGIPICLKSMLLKNLLLKMGLPDMHESEMGK